MCYSAQVWADWWRYRKLGGTLDIKGFVRLIDEMGGRPGWIRKLPKATRDSLLDVRTEEGMALAKAVREANRAAEAMLRDELQAQADRLTAAEAVLAGPKPTKKAANDQRIATDKISRAQRDLDDLVRTEAIPSPAARSPASGAKPAPAGPATQSGAQVQGNDELEPHAAGGG